MANKRYEQNTVPNYMKGTRSGKIAPGVGYTIREGWINPKRKQLLKEAGYQTEYEIKLGILEKDIKLLRGYQNFRRNRY